MNETRAPTAPPADSADVRHSLIEALRLDLIGPRPQDSDLQHERLPQAPSRWYLTGFLAPSEAPDAQRAQDAEEELDAPAEAVQGGDDSRTPECGSGKRAFLPSSIGLSVLVDAETQRLAVALSWGDYTPDAEAAEDGDAAPGGGEDRDEDKDEDDKTPRQSFRPWVRRPRAANVAIDLSTVEAETPAPRAVPDSDGLELVCLARKTRVRTAEGERDSRAVSLFIVNRRPPEGDDDRQDAAFAFQVEMRVEADRPLVPRYDASGLDSDDWDERLADLHYRDVAEYAVGHNVSTHADAAGGECRIVRTEWMPQAPVARVEPSEIAGVEFGMEALGALADAAGAKRALDPLIARYRDCIDAQRASAGAFAGRRREVADELARRAARAADRIQAGVDLLADADALDAFRIANRAMAAAARRRRAREEGREPGAVDPPVWRPFQLAYILMNLRGIADPTHDERELVDLLFFPTGGGKTEAYLGLAAFTLVLRRLRDPAPVHRGLSVLMRYTLRLLTLDQLGRAAALICALELERETAPERLGEWPFEIALWVGRAATPNYMGRRGDTGDNTARARTLRFALDSSRDPPLPLDRCPWCGEKFNKHSFRLHPNSDEPTDLHVSCANRRCDFTAGRKRRLPVVAVDEPIYRRAPAFMIATADKFAALPWNGETARFFRGGDPENPRPPDLIVQDELHLISGPLGTMAGLYETAIDRLCRRRVGDREVRPKIVASTATVRLASKQIRALFDRPKVEAFPPPGADRRDSFFAKHAPEDEASARRYIGVAAQGRGPKVLFLRSAITLMAAAQAAWEAASGAGANPADPYMTVVAYFNALRELGSARRIVEDEIGSRLLTYADRKRAGEAAGRFANRRIAFEPVELTSRVGTASVAEAKRRLALGFDEDDRVDFALATNMISVGLDILRLGLMVVSGQPKTTAEYIQATSRVGRDPSRPGLAVTLLNIHKPRDRSHYERFSAFHASFYRGVEATGVTPFSPRALDRGLPAVAVALARLGIEALTPTPAAKDIAEHDDETQALAEAVGARAQRHAEDLPAGFGDDVRDRVRKLIDDWAALAGEAGRDGVSFGYALGREGGVSTPLLRETIDPARETLTDLQLRFRAPRSLRDVEPGVLLRIETPEGKDLKRDVRRAAR